MDKQLWPRRRPQAAGGLETAPRDPVPWLPAREVRAGAFPAGRVGNAVALLVTFAECLVLLCQGLF